MSLYVVAIALLLFFSSAILSVLRSIFNAIVTFFSANADEFASFLSSPKVLSFLTFLVIALYIAAIIFFVCFIIVKKRHASEEEAEWFRQAYEAELLDTTKNLHAKRLSAYSKKHLSGNARIVPEFVICPVGSMSNMLQLRCKSVAIGIFKSRLKATITVQILSE